MKEVYAHLCTWFKTKEYSGHWEMWNSDWAQTPHNPDTIFDNGKNDIAANCYPLTNVYDSSDPDVIEYQFLLMKLSGIDGVIIDWDGTRLNPYRHQTLMDIVPHLKKFNMKIIMCFEEWAGYEPRNLFPTRESQINAAKKELEWMFENIACKDFYATINGKKPVLIFRKIPDLNFNVEEFGVLSKYMESQGGCAIFPEYGEAEYDKYLGGRYFWVGGFDKNNYNSIEFRNKLYIDFLESMKTKKAHSSSQLTIGSIIPGFDDTYVWGWGDLPRIAPRHDGERFCNDWEITIKYNPDIVQVITWNDWNEGSHIEPSDTFGYKYLELNKKYSAAYKGIEDKVPNEALRLPLEIFKMRKAKINEIKLNEAVEALLDGDYEKASLIMNEL